jgi:hypothetical protein
MINTPHSRFPGEFQNAFPVKALRPFIVLREVMLDLSLVGSPDS